MDKPKILIADSDISYGKRLVRMLSPSYQVCPVATDGGQLVTLAQKHIPNIIIAEIILSNLDGLSALEFIKKSVAPSAIVYIHTCFENGYLHEYVLTKSYHFLGKPIEQDLLLKTISQQNLPKIHLIQEFIGIENEIAANMAGNLLQMLGVSPKLMGYQYLKYGILYLAKEQKYLSKCNVYEILSKQFHQEISRMERTMRYAVESAFEKGDIEVIQSIFGYTIDSAKGKPGNIEFMTMLAEHLKQRIIGEI